MEKVIGFAFWSDSGVESKHSILILKIHQVCKEVNELDFLYTMVESGIKEKNGKESKAFQPKDNANYATTPCHGRTE